MPTQLQFRRGTTAQTATFTGASGEVTVDTSQNILVVHDGSTAGGWPAPTLAYVQAAFAAANTDTSGLAANVAYLQGVENTQNTNITAVNTYAGSAYAQANATNTYTTSAYNQANVTNTYATSAYNTANSKFNSSGGTISGNVVVTGNITPTTANTYTLGTLANPWQELYVGPGSVNIGGISLSNNNGILTVGGATDLAIAGSSNPNTSTISATANSAQANTIGLQGVTNSLNVQISIIQGVDVTQNTNITAVNTYATSGYNQANVGTILAQAAFNAANNVFPQIQPAYNTANAAFVQANASNNLAQSAYNQANTTTTNLSNQITLQSGVDAYQNTFISAVQTYSQSAYSFANGTNGLAQAAYNTANSKFSSSGGLISGNVTVNGSLSVTGNITYIGNVTTQVISGNTGEFFGQTSNGFGALYSGIPVGYTFEPQTISQHTGNYQGYIQVNLQNVNNSNNATGDIVITADNGSANDTYIDMGITSSTYTQSGYGLTGPNDGYLYVSGNTYTGGGNLVLSTYTAKDIIFSTNGGDTGNEVARITHANTVVIKSNIATTGQASGSLQVIGGVGIQGDVQAQNVYSLGTNIVPYFQGINNTTNTNVTAVNTYAGSAYAQANATNTYATSSYNQANATNTYATSAYNQANATNTYAVSAYNQANATNTYATSGYGQANTATTLAQAAFNQANATNTYAGSAYAQANTTATNLSNEISYVGGVDNTQNNNITLLQGYVNTANANIAAAFAQANVANTRAYNTVLKSGDTMTGSLTVTGSLSNIIVSQSTTSSDIANTYAHAYTLGMFSGNTDQSIQIGGQNFANTSNASTDLALYNNVGTDTNNYIDMGITSKAYNTVLNSFTASQPGDGYLYANGSNLIIGTYTPGTNMKVFVGGYQASNVAAVFNSANTPATSLSSGTLTIAGGIGATGNVYANNIFVNGLFWAANGNVISTGGGTSGGGSNVIAGNDVFNGNGTQTSFTLTTIPYNANNSIVNINGVIQQKSQYTISGSTLTFTYPPFNGDVIEVMEFSAANGVFLSSNGTSYTGILNISNTTPSTSQTTGAITVVGGIGVGGDVQAQNVYSQGTNLLSYFQGIENTQNTNITAVNTYATSAYNQANATNTYATSAYAKANNALANTSGTIFGGNLSISGTLSVTGNIVTQNYETITYTEIANTLQANTVTVTNTTLTATVGRNIIQATTATTAQTTIDTWSSSTYRTAKYIIQMTQSTNYHAIELLVIQNGTTAYLTQYGELITNTSLATFDASVSGGNFNLLVNPASSSTTVINIVRDLISA